MKENLIMCTDSYKHSQPWQYPENMISMFDYAEARSSKVYPTTLFHGLQGIINKYLTIPITEQEIKEAHIEAHKHGIPFNINGWTHILTEHKGFLPVEIKAVQEGTLVPTGNALFTIKSTDEKVPWIVGFLETLLMKTWYPSNIATRSYYVKQMIQKYWDQTVPKEDHFGINFAFHNFGDRGSSSVESAAIGGTAHLTQFLGTDNFNSLNYAKKYYNSTEPGYSIPATEHSTTTAWGKESELDMIMAHLEFNKGKVDTIAAVCDSYDYLKTVDAVTSGEFKSKIESDGYPKFIIRPDSDNPIDMIHQTLTIMKNNNVKYTINSEGFKVFDKYGIIWGDGITMDIMETILAEITLRGYAASNIAFGSGGWLMQQHDRDTQGWAVKCSQITLLKSNPNNCVDIYDYKCTIDKITRDVFKDPITDPGKTSKKGELTLWYNKKSKDYKTESIHTQFESIHVIDALQTVYKNGEIFNQQTLEEIRTRNDN